MGNCLPFANGPDGGKPRQSPSMMSNQANGSSENGHRDKSAAASESASAAAANGGEAEKQMASKTGKRVSDVTSSVVKRASQRLQVVVRNRVLDDSLPGMKERFSVGRVLGQGAYGTVYLIEDKTTKERFAMKSMVKAKMTRHDREYVKKEADIMKACKEHPNVVQYICAFEDDVHVHLVLALCSGGELFDRIVAKGHYSEKDARNVVRTMLDTLVYLHSKCIIHRDLKPENYLLHDPSDAALLKLTDFGVSDFFEPGQFLTEKVGSPTYVAPEVIMGRYNEKCDIWSLGVIVYILLCGRTPFYGKNEKEEFERARCGKFTMQSEPWPRISKEAKDLVKRMLTVNIDMRPSAAELLNHPWIAVEGVASDVPLGEYVFKGLQEYAEMNKLKRRALQVMASNLSEADVAHLKKIFAQIDTDSSGSVSPAEMKEAMRKAGTNVSDEELDLIITSYDVDGDGEIDLSEFISAMTDISKLNTEENIRKAFAEFDKDGSGSITADEVLHALRDVAHMDLEEAKRVVKEADTNGDGEISWEEFYNFMMKNDAAMAKAHSGIRNRSYGR
ncbi:Calcium-dependent protein kinase 10 [Porphyridium purpureum]|uniref:Calcium-dependent protein kinase 10 n=1 Tax=Porphyridium purpureum TaxID=35688 RepID=A0A5J4YP23_PORPP|nr:Calcium-dependent protein kinase 10 [Porphyridium purpureum]|eukprot:POR3398..scf222_8